MTLWNIPSLGHALERQMFISLLLQLNFGRVRPYWLVGVIKACDKKCLKNAIGNK